MYVHLRPHCLYLIEQINDPTSTGRLIAFNEDAERLAPLMKSGPVLKISYMKWTVPDEKYAGSTTCPFEFRADRGTMVAVDSAYTDPEPEPQVSLSYPQYVTLFFLSFTYYQLYKPLNLTAQPSMISA